jgi:hypothetical protein
MKTHQLPRRKNFRFHEYLQGGLRPIVSRPRPATPPVAPPAFFPVMRKADVVGGRISININGVIMRYRLASGTSGFAPMPESGTVMMVIRRGRWHSAEVFALPEDCDNTWAFCGTAVADVEANPDLETVA